MKRILHRLVLVALLCLSVTTAVVVPAQPAAADEGCTATAWPPSWYDVKLRIPKSEASAACGRNMLWVRADALLTRYSFGSGKWIEWAANTNVWTNANYAYAQAWEGSCQGMGEQEFKGNGRAAGLPAATPAGRPVNDPADGASYRESWPYTLDCVGGGLPLIRP